MAGLVELSPGFQTTDLRAIDGDTSRVQWRRPLSEGDVINVAKAVAPYPEIMIRLYGEAADNGLDFLPHLKEVKQFAIDCFEAKSLEPLAHLSPKLTSLSIGRTRSKTFSLTLLKRFPALRELYIEGHSKGLDTIATLTSIETLGLRSLALADLSFLAPLRKLRLLQISLGSAGSIDALATLDSIRTLSLTMIRDLRDLTPIASMKNLEVLILDTLGKIETLPSFAPLKKLWHVELCAMKGIVDLAPLARAPALRELAVWEAGHMKPENFQCLVGHKTLTHLGASLGSAKKNDAVKAILPLASPSMRPTIMSS